MWLPKKLCFYFISCSVQLSLKTNNVHIRATLIMHRLRLFWSIVGPHVMYKSNADYSYLRTIMSGTLQFGASVQASVWWSDTVLRYHTDKNSVRTIRRCRTLLRLLRLLCHFVSRHVTSRVSLCNKSYYKLYSLLCISFPFRIYIYINQWSIRVKRSGAYPYVDAACAQW